MSDQLEMSEVRRSVLQDRLDRLDTESAPRVEDGRFVDDIPDVADFRTARSSCTSACNKWAQDRPAVKYADCTFIGFGMSETGRRSWNFHVFFDAPGGDFSAYRQDLVVYLGDWFKHSDFRPNNFIVTKRGW